MTIMAKNETEDPLKGKYASNLSGRDLRASSIGWEIALPIVSGPLIGYFIDRRLQTGITFTLILLGVGLVVAVISLIRFIVYEFSLINESKKEDHKDNE